MRVAVKLLTPISSIWIIARACGRNAWPTVLRSTCRARSRPGHGHKTLYAIEVDIQVRLAVLR